MNKSNKDFKSKEYLRHGPGKSADETQDLQKFRKSQDFYIRKSRTKEKFFRLLFLTAIAALIIFAFFWVYNEFFRPIDTNKEIDKNSIHYVNDLYASDGHFYETLLTETQQKIYLEWLRSIKNIDLEFAIDYENYKGQSISDIKNDIYYIHKILMMDHPELFYFSDYILEGNTVYDLVVKNSYIVENKFIIDLYERRLLRKLDDLYHEFKSLETDYAKEKAVYNWITNKKEGIDTLRINNTATSAMITRKTTHVGAAYASQIILKRLGLESYLVFGYKDDPRVFNLVSLEDGIYYYDAGVGVSTINKDDLIRRMKGFNILAIKKYSVHYMSVDSTELGKKYLNDVE